MRLSTTTARHRLLGDLTWHLEAACRPTRHRLLDPEIFYPEPDNADAIAEAKTLCRQCPMRRACLDAALETKDTWGIRGGMTEEERAELHAKLSSRCDWTRVNEALAGRDIHLTRAERAAIVRVAWRDGIPGQQLAHVLKVTTPHAKKLLRETARAANHKAVQGKPAEGRTGFGKAA